MTFDDACTLTKVSAGAGLFTFSQSAGWTGPTDGTDGPTDFVIWDEGASGFISPRTNTFQERVIRCLWGDYLAIATILCGPPPAVHPENESLSVESVKFEGVVGTPPPKPGATSGFPTGLVSGPVGETGYTYARLTIRYTPWIQYTLDADYSVEPLVISNSAQNFTWPDGTALDPSECPTVRQATAVYKLVNYSQLITPNFTLYNGFVNSVALNLPQANYTFPIGTLLLDGASTQTILQSTGQPYKPFTCIFKWLPNGWNYFYRPSTGTSQAVLNSAGQAPYQSVDFTPLFA